MTRRAVVLFVQPPSRDARRKGLPGAAPLFDLLLRRTVAAVAPLAGVDLVVAGDPGTARLPEGARVIRQRGGSFAERLAGAFGDARALGYGDVVAVGADSPGLSERHLVAAFDALRSCEVVLGPASDGGIYLFGCRGAAGPLLRSVRWRTEQVLAQLLERCPGAALLAEVLADVDDRADLRALLVGPALAPEIVRLISRLLTCPAGAPGCEPEWPHLAPPAPSDPRGPPPIPA